MIVGAFLQPPRLPLLGAGVVAVVVEQEGPHLATDGWVNTAEEDGLWEVNTVSTKGVLSNVQRASRGHTAGITSKRRALDHILYANKTSTYVA